MAAIVTSPLQVLAVLCVALLGVKGQFGGLGKCPNVTGFADFKLKDYLGVWYEAQGYWSFLDIPVRCPAIEYGLLPNGNILIEKHYTDLMNRPRMVESEATIDSQVPYIFRWRIPRGNPFFTFQTEVLYTDYTDYAIIWTCREILFARNEYAWIMTRKRLASAETIEAARKKIVELGLNTGRLADVNQSRCKDVTPKLSNNTKSMNETTTSG